MRSNCLTIILSSNFLKEVGSLFGYIEVGVRYRGKKSCMCAYGRNDSEMLTTQA